VTAYASTETVHSVLEAGVWQVLSKPVDFARLRQLVDEAFGKPLLLIVDDDEDLCQSLWDVFQEEGFRVGLAHNLPEAAEQLGRHEPQVVIADMKLPQGDGAEVAALVRQCKPAARTLLITGYRSETEESVRRALAEGAEAVCYKPFDVPQLLEKVRLLLRRN
jgi:DNA-binding response OmpR family regulator